MRARERLPTASVMRTKVGKMRQIKDVRTGGDFADFEEKKCKRSRAE